MQHILLIGSTTPGICQNNIEVSGHGCDNIPDVSENTHTEIH